MSHRKEYSLIFIGGVHGAGKTVFSSALANSFCAQHVTASSLIRSHLALGKNKLVEDVNSNQNVLIEALAYLEITHQRLLMDGHFCLMNKQGNIEHVPLDTFIRINPKGLILISAEPSIIEERLIKRDGESPALSVISSFQEEEISWAKVIANTLNVPLILVSGSTESEINNPKIKSMFEE